MLKKLNLIAVMVIATILWIGCQKEISDDGIIITPTPDPSWTSQAVNPATHPARQLLNAQAGSGSSSFNNGIGTNFITPGGLLVNITSNIFVKLDGSPVTGNVDITYKEATKFADMMYHGLATATGSGLLETGGMINIAARQGSDALKIKIGSTMNILFPGAANPSFRAFAGTATGNVENPVVWEVNNNWRADTSFFQGTGATRITIDSIGWINCDRFYNEPNPTNIYLKLPDGYGNTNTVCFIVFKTDKVMAGLYPDAANKRYWQGSSYKVPGGKQVVLVAVSKKDSKNYFGSAAVTISPDMTVTIPSMEEVTDAVLKQRLNAL
jgi:hypothetical protein